MIACYQMGLVCLRGSTYIRTDRQKTHNFIREEEFSLMFNIPLFLLPKLSSSVRSDLLPINHVQTLDNVFHIFPWVPIVLNSVLKTLTSMWYINICVLIAGNIFQCPCINVGAASGFLVRRFLGVWRTESFSGPNPLKAMKKRLHIPSSVPVPCRLVVGGCSQMIVRCWCLFGEMCAQAFPKQPPTDQDSYVCVFSAFVLVLTTGTPNRVHSDPDPRVQTY